MDAAKESRTQKDARVDAALLELNEQMIAVNIHNQTMFDDIKTMMTTSELRHDFGILRPGAGASMIGSPTSSGVIHQSPQRQQQHEHREPHHAYCLGRIEFPRFSGSNIASWFYQVEHYFEIDRISDDAKLKVAVIHLKGEALQWYQEYMKIQSKKGRMMSCSEYVATLQARFDEELYGDPIFELKNLHQEGSFPEYQSRFNALLHRVQLIENVSD